MERVKVINKNDSWRGTECYAGKNKINNVKSIDFHVSVDEVPTFTFETEGVPEMDMLGKVEFSFAPETIREASIILRNELINKNSEFRKAFEASVIGALKEMQEESDLKDAAEEITDRIAGFD